VVTVPWFIHDVVYRPDQIPANPDKQASPQGNAK
jgi:hypothetical protein